MGRYTVRVTPPADEMILQLDESDRFKIKKDWLARPDTPAGYAFYKAQAQALMDTYPQINTVTLWRRSSGYVWPTIEKEHMPKAWQVEYEAIVKDDPEAEKLYQSAASFSMAKVAVAWRKALDELGREEVELATGSWGFSWVEAVAKFYPKEIKITPLDSEVARGTQNLRNEKLMKRFVL